MVKDSDFLTSECLASGYRTSMSTPKRHALLVGCVQGRGKDFVMRHLGESRKNLVSMTHDVYSAGGALPMRDIRKHTILLNDYGFVSSLPGARSGGPASQYRSSGNLNTYKAVPGLAAGSYKIRKRVVGLH